MLWNWNTIDACFLSSSWHVKSHAMFAASCIGVALLVVCLEFLRRLSRETDAYFMRSFQRHLRMTNAAIAASNSNSDSLNTHIPNSYDPYSESQSITGYATYRASPLQQLVRAILHGMTLGVAYIVMLLAMYFNGYIIISIIIGAALGKFLCDWMVVRIPYEVHMGLGLGEVREKDVKDVRRASVAACGPTGCCA